MSDSQHVSEHATIFIVDDNEELNRAVSLNLTNEGYKTKVFNNAEDFLNAYRPDTLGCLLLDVRMPGMTGDQLQQALIEKNIEIPIIFMSGYSDVPVAVETLKKGALDFLTKPIDNYTLLKSVNYALQEDIKHRKRAEANADTLDRLNSLTKRERQVMELIVEGKLNKIIADKLNISVNTVENHRASMMRKMDVKTIADLVCKCLINNIVHVEKQEIG